MTSEFHITAMLLQISQNVNLGSTLTLVRASIAAMADEPRLAGMEGSWHVPGSCHASLRRQAAPAAQY